MFFDYPADEEIMEELKRTICAKSLHYMYYQPQVSQEDILKMFSGMIKYTCNNLEGNFVIGRASAALGLTDEIVMTLLEIFKDSGMIKILSRDEVLVMLSDNLQDINHKLKHGKIRDKTNAKIKNAQLNSLVYLAQNYLKGLKDKQLDEIKQDLMELKSGNISNDEFERNIIASADKGVDLSEIERIESIIESFDGE